MECSIIDSINEWIRITGPIYPSGIEIDSERANGCGDTKEAELLKSIKRDLT